MIEHQRAHLDRRLTLAELAAIAGLRPFHFPRAFVRRYGVTPGVYQRQLRHR